MRLVCGLAIALGLSFPAWGQTPAAPAPAETTAPAENKAPDSVAKEKTDAGTPSAATKHRKRLPEPDGTPRKVVVRQGGASEPTAQISPGLTPAEAARQRQNAEQWLGSAGDQLKQLAGRTLEPQQQETVGQIRNYMDGARSALQEGDVRRASTLAEKAHLLAEELIKH